MSQLYDLPFDQYQRYQLVSLLVQELREKDETLEILDVGGRTALLRGFLERDRVTLVDLEPSGEKGLVLGDGAALPFRDQSFDLVCAFDTLEHVPPALRTRFVNECARVARRWVVLAGPYQSPAVEEAEKLLQEFLRGKLGVRHRYLEEHRQHGLPVLETVTGQLEKLGARVATLGHGNVQRWLALISLSMYMDHTPALQAQAVRLQRFYNSGLFADDTEEPVYRHAVVAALGKARLPAVRPARAASRAPAKELLHFAQELAAFDAHRDGYLAEFERLQQALRALTADLDGHKRTLEEAQARRDEAQRAMRDLASDLAGHQRTLKETAARRSEAEQVIATLERDLEGHRRKLQQESAQRAEAQTVIQTLERDLAGHRAALEELRAERAESETTIAKLLHELEGHGGTLENLAQSVVRHKTLLADRERELAQQREVLSDLRADLEGHRESLAAQRREIEQRARELSESQARELRGQGELRNAREQLADVRAALERARAEILEVAGTVEQRERLIGLLRAELKNRVRSLRRALGPARPTPGE